MSPEQQIAEQQEMDAVQEQETIAKVREQRPDILWPEPEETFLWGGVQGAEQDYTGFMGVYLHGFDQKGEEITVALPPRTEEYKTIRHEVLYDRMISSLEQFEEYGKPKVSVRMYDYGAKMELSARYPETKIKINSKDEASPEIGFRNSYDLGWQQSGFGGCYVWRCSNGMFAGHEAFAWKKKHRLNYDINKQVETMMSGMGRMSAQFDVWKGWAQLKMDEAKTMKLFETCQKNGTISEKQTETLLALPETGTGMRLEDVFKTGKDTTLWSVNSIITQWLTHDVNDSSGRRDREEKVAITLDRFAKNHLN